MGKGNPKMVLTKKIYFSFKAIEMLDYIAKVNGKPTLSGLNNKGIITLDSTFEEAGVKITTG
jgi:hypothetical protein